MNRIELLGLGLEEMEQIMTEMGLPRFRARQVFHWIYKHHVHSFYDMRNIPKELRQYLDERASISLPRVIKARVSKDGTRKFLLELTDKKRIETVAIPQFRADGKKFTICVSSQVGCPIGCNFCATGLSGFERDLTAGEIVGQVVAVEREIKKREKPVPGDRYLTNVVFMGMGEPLLNLEAVLMAISLINDERGIGIGERHLTISTSGFVPGIRELSCYGLQVTLAVSLHATTDEVRNQIIPLNRKYPLQVLMEAVADYIEKTGRRVTFEYVLLDGINTSREDARRLAQMAKPLLVNVNLIPYNQTGDDGFGFRKPSPETVYSFHSYLIANGVNATVREEMGGDIEAACGQLRRRTASVNRKQEIGSANSK